MANYATLKAAIQQVVKTNGNNEITGALLQQSLLAMINSLGGYYQFAGIATPSTNPGTPDQNVFYLASTAGTYSNFGSIVIAENEAAILKYNGTWSKDSSGFATSEKVNQLQQKVTDLSDDTLGTGCSIVNTAENAWTNAIPIKLRAGVTYVISTALTSGPAIIATTNSNGTHNAQQEIERISYNAGISPSMDYTPSQDSNYVWIYAGTGFPAGTTITFKAKNNLKDSIVKNTQDIATINNTIGGLEDEISSVQTDVKGLRQDVFGGKLSVPTQEQQAYVAQFHFIAGRSYRITNKGTSGSFTAYLADSETTSASARVQTISSNGIFFGESVVFVANVNADYINGYSNTISVMEISPVNVSLEERVDNAEDGILAIEGEILYRELVKTDSLIGVLRVDNLSATTSRQYQHIEFVPKFGKKYSVYCTNVNSTYPAAFLNDANGHYMRILGGTDGQDYSGEVITIPSENEVEQAGLNISTTKLYINISTTVSFPRAYLISNLNGSELVGEDFSIEARIVKREKTLSSNVPDRALIFAYHIEKGVTYKIENLSATGVQQMKFLDANGNYIQVGGSDLAYSFYSAQKYVENHELVFVADFDAEFLRVYPNAETTGIAIKITGGLADVLDLPNMANEMKHLRESIAASLYMRPMNSGCVMSIIGDSISTFGQKRYCYYYNSAIQAAQYPDSDVRKVEQCYWYKLLRRQCCELGENYSFSGSCATTGITSLPNLMERVALVPETTDICVLALGTNDSNGNAPLGVYDYDSPIADLDDTTFIGAYTKAVKTLLETNPNMQLLFVSMKMTDTYANAMKNIAEHFGMFYVDARGYSTYDGTHPNAKGMLDIYKSINDYLSDYYAS